MSAEPSSSAKVSLGDLWESAPPVAGVFQSSHVADLPEPALRYLEHAIAPSTRRASAVRLRMHGEIKLGRWLPFSAEQVIHAKRGFIWSATVRLLGIPIFRGFDRLVDGEGAMRWKLLGMIPMVTDSGPDITRSALGRVEAESLWLPSVLVRREVRWTALDSRHAAARLGGQPDATPVEFAIDQTGRLESVKMQRWGNPGGGAFRLADFGGVMEAEGTFGGYTIPTRVREWGGISAVRDLNRTASSSVQRLMMRRTGKARTLCNRVFVRRWAVLPHFVRDVLSRRCARSR